MIKVFFSHLGERSLAGINTHEQVSSGSILDIFGEIDLRHHGFFNEVVSPDGKSLNSATLLFKHVELDADGHLLEGEQTKQISNLYEKLADGDENLLVALFHPEQLLTFLLDTLTPTEERFEYSGGKKSYRAYISSPEDAQNGQRLFATTNPEPLYPFTNGRAMKELITDGLIDVAQQKFIPRSLQQAIAQLWEISEHHPLRLFQEDALCHILQELSKAEDTLRQPLLLSIPTGGGKTEAFLIPLIAHLHDERERLLRSGIIPQPAIRTIVIYPTRALANDQAKRISEILFQMNNGVIEDRKISIGVLTGDTPNSGQNLQTEKSILQLCPRCSAVLTNFPEKSVQDSGKTITIARCICGVEIDYFRLVRQDILNFPPDILITSPDMINYMLQSPRYHKRIFSSSIDMVVFDEIHMYSSVFGCNVAHLLRRFEEACHRKPLYVGVSATIRNAKELACLIFDSDMDAVRYLRPRREQEEESEELRSYLNYQAPPSRYRYHYALTPTVLGSGERQKVTTTVLNIADVIGHILRDPHFRKTLIFSNFRQDTDDVLRFLRDQEDRYYGTYHQSILPRLLAMRGTQNNTGTNVSFSKIELDVIGAVDRWFQRALALGILYQPNLEVGWHRGGLEKEERIKAVNRFAMAQRLSTNDEEQSDLPIDLMVATSTLELGIDIGDVTTVINCGAPFTTNEYTQRVGRGGRRKDSLALTVIDTRNPLDFYFLKHFDEYAHPTPDTFEDAPIIISNQEVMKTHILARFLDRAAYYLGESYKDEIQVSDVLDLHLPGSNLSFRSNWQLWSHAIFDEVFPLMRVEVLQDWIKREASIISGIRATEITREEIWIYWQQKCQQLHEHLNDGKLREIDNLSGMAAKDRELVPDLRSSGPGVGLYLVSEAGDDILRDTVSRRQAMSSRPVGGYASQGSVTFKIEGLKENDHDTERKVKELLVHSPQATAYFHTMFGDSTDKSPFPTDPIEVLINTQLETPKDLRVKYNPYRFYCPKCGATYSDKKPGDERCTSCYSPLRQLTEVYMCGNCGGIYPPPVPKVCLNADCIAQATSRKDKTAFMDGGYKRIGKRDLHNDYFRFTALPMLNWQCRACGTELNYHAYHELSPILQSQLNNATWGNNSPAQIAKSFLYKPESWWGKTYDQDGFYPARFNCPKCKKEAAYKKIFVKNIPSFRSVIHEYILTQGEIAPVHVDTISEIYFNRVNIIALAREHFRRFFDYPKRSTSIDIKPIFSDGNKYLANVYNAHAAFFRFNKVLDRFVTTEASLYCNSGTNCSCRGRSSQQILGEDNEPEENESTSPLLTLKKWEKDRKPDPRRKWCRVVQGKESGKKCPGQEMSCQSCDYFIYQRHQRYLILHTLEHAIITAMPKYTGINKNQIRGTLYPNDEQDYDLVLVDTIEGGSGCMYLLRKNWQQIWKVAGELLEAARNEQGELLLPYTCHRYNHDLCPHLAYEFYKYVTQAGR